MNPFRKAVDRWFGRGEASITMPPMDGAFRPNDLLDRRRRSLRRRRPIASPSRRSAWSSRSDRSLAQHRQAGRFRLASFERPNQRFDRIAGWRRGGRPDRRQNCLHRRPRGGTMIVPSPEVACITALAPAADGGLLVANGSATNGPDAWKRDLMEKNASGSVWRIDPANGARHAWREIWPTLMACSRTPARSSSRRAGAAR